MNRNEQFLSLIGLCLRGRNLEVGEEPVEAVARARDARVLLLASDAADNTARRVQHFAEAGQCVWLRIPFTKQELGRPPAVAPPPWPLLQTSALQSPWSAAWRRWTRRNMTKILPSWN